MQVVREKIMPGRGIDVAQAARDFYEPVFRFCARHVGKDLASDAAQETFLTAHKVRQNFRGESSLRTWLFGIALNECRRLARQKRIEPSTVPLIDVSQQDEGQSILDRRLLQEALQKLSAEHREVVVLHEIEGLTYEEAAKVLDVPVGTVKSRLHHAFLQLRRSLDTTYEGATR